MGHRLVGESFELGADEIQSITGHLSSALIGDQLSIDTIEATVRPDRAFHQGFIPSGSDSLVTADSLTFLSVDTSINAIRSAFIDGTPIQWYSGTNLKGKFFVDDLYRVGTNAWQISASSAIGLLHRKIHNGGIYGGITASTLLAEIIGNTFSYTVSTAVGGQYVSGWLPRASARDNLHQLMLALGINITKDSDGNVNFVFVESGTPTSISNDRVFLGGRVQRTVPASRVEVITHQFIAMDSDEVVVLFDNTTVGVANHQLVTFSEAPMHDLTGAGLTIHESNANYAIVSGIGMLTGKKYTHITTLLGRDNASANTENVKTLSADTLVNDLNGELVLERLYDYYTATDSVDTDIVVEGELPNQLVELEDAFGDTRDLWIKSMDVQASTILRAACQMIDGYTPGNNGNKYTHFVRKTADGSWTVPSGVTQIRLILIGGGQGGQGGHQGGTGHGGQSGWGGEMIEVEGGHQQEAWYYSSQDPVEGGAPGEPGESGKMYAIDLAVTAGVSISMAMGSGGTGGDAGGNPGTDGTATTAVIGGTTYSSDDGYTSPGFVDTFSGNTYCTPGEAGHKGGDAGLSDIVTLRAYGGAAGYAGGSVGSYSGGAGGAGIKREIPSLDYLHTSLYVNNSDLTQNGITGTWDEDNEYITLSGTASGKWELRLSPQNEGETTYLIPCTGGATMYFRGENISESIYVKITFTLSDSTTTDILVTSNSEDITVPSTATAISYVGLIVPSGTVLSSSVAVKAMLGSNLITACASGGGGGGAAWGAAGGAGQAAYVVERTSYDNYFGGAGGQGADAQPPDTPTYGCGGGGGNGGGASGSGGGGRVYNTTSAFDVSIAHERTAGGSGSRGGHGGAGCVLIYY